MELVVMRYLICFVLLVSHAHAVEWSLMGTPPVSQAVDWTLYDDPQAEVPAVATVTRVTVPVESKPTQATTRPYYPTSKPRWNINGNWNPSRATVLSHLRSSANHRGKHWQSWPLESWSLAELRSLHDDDHEGRVKSLGTTSRQRTVTTPVRQTTRTVTRSRGVFGWFRSTCPNGRCPR